MKTIGKTFLTTLKKDKSTKSGIILTANDNLNSEGLLKDVQEVVVSNNNCAVKKGDRVKLNLARYLKKRSKGQMERKEEVLEIPTIEIDGNTYGKFGEYDIDVVL